MKKYKYIIFIYLIAVACNSINDQKEKSQYEALIFNKLKCMNMPRPSDSYNYPIYPGTKEWENLSTSEEMSNACQIPTNILENMSTQAVIQAIWEYPLLFLVFQRYVLQTDFEALFSQNNAYIELSKRKDAGIALFNRLVLADPLTKGATQESQVLELLISQTVFLSQLNNDQKKKIVEITLTNDNLRQNDVELVNSSGRATAWLLIGRTMIAADYAPFVKSVNENNQLKYFIDSKVPNPNVNFGYTGYVYMKEVYGDIPQLIINCGKDFLD
jgi:hypothetical protein